MGGLRHHASTSRRLPNERRSPWSLFRVAASQALLPIAVLSLIAAVSTGCETKRSPGGTISAAQFVAPAKAANGLRELTTELDLRFVTGVPDTLAGSSVDPLGDIGGNKLLLFVAAGNALASVDLCPTCSDTGARSAAALHYSRRGLEDELGRRVTGVVGNLIQFSSTVPPLQLRNGWTLLYETSTDSLVGVRYDPTFRPIRAGAASANSGAGNGVILTAVLRRQDIALQLVGDSEAQVPQISRLHELADGRVVVFFQSAATQLGDAFVLTLEIVNEMLDVDLDDPSAASVQPVGLLRGRFDTPNHIFTSERVIEAAANPNAIPGTSNEVVLDAFQPVTLPVSGDLLVYETVSSSFLTLKSGSATRIVTAATLRSLLNSAGPYTMGATWTHPTEPLILIVEEVNNVILALNFQSFALSRYVESAGVVSPRDPRLPTGTIVPPGGDLPELRVATNNIRENRLIFDSATDRLLSLNYDARQLVVVLKAIDFFETNGNTIANYTFMRSLGEKGGVERVRVWDSASFSLYDLSLTYTTLPVTAR